jgi:predicted DNA-binding transcriptional regulator YafY
MSKISNVISLLQILSTGRKYSINELANTLEVTPRMIRVYKEELEKAGIFIDTIRGPYGGYILNQHIYLPKENAIDKLNMSEMDKKIYNIITKSIKEKRKVELTYLSSDGEIRKRIIHPHDLYVHEHNWYIPSYCEYRKSMRHFQFKNVRDIKLLEEYFN